MGGKKVLLTLTEEEFNKFESLARRDGFTRVSALVRHLAVTGLNETADGKSVRIGVDDDVLDYVRIKKFGSVASFATWAMESVMQRTPLTETQRARLGK